MPVGSRIEDTSGAGDHQRAAASPTARVVLAAAHSLVGEAVLAALVGHGREVVQLPWPATPEAAAQMRRSAPTGRLEAPATGVLLCDLEPPRRLHEARLVVRDVPMRWLLLTDARPGPLWGAMLELGVAHVLSNKTTLDQLLHALSHLDEPGPWQVGDRDALIEEWRAMRAQQAGMKERVRSLSPRETTVLAMLHAGRPVREIAERLGVSDTTVRSQVRAILRKLAVASQLAAVAAYAAVLEDSPPAVPEPRTGSGPGA